MTTPTVTEVRRHGMQAIALTAGTRLDQRPVGTGPAMQRPASGPSITAAHR